MRFGSVHVIEHCPLQNVLPEVLRKILFIRAASNAAQHPGLHAKRHFGLFAGQDYRTVSRRKVRRRVEQA